ncbi:N-acetylglucosaminyl-diphospho-decaprenol L-rhamnosyltransferase [Arthrobacter sp. UYCu511]|uniref:glycosyltransferase n=1 Tax=Arthrobacter sp. UYCu511 TaxID=3156337 RepID=UPI0033913F0E
MNKSWTIITVTYNSEAVLSKYWANVRLPPNVQWIVVDNASEDDSVRVARQIGAKVIELEENVGFAAANNIALAESNAEFIVFVNPDVRVVGKDFDKISEVLSENPLSLVSPQLVSLDGTLQPNGRMGPYLIYKVLNRIFPKLVTGRYTNVFESHETGAVTWLTGAVVAGKRDVFHRLQGWDDHFFVYYEDTDLALRAAHLGIKSMVIGQLNWVHGWAREASGLNFRGWMLEYSSALKFYRRYPKYLFLPNPWSLGSK